MYTRQEREGILWEFHRSGLSVRRACATLPLFPNPDNLYRWLYRAQRRASSPGRCPTGRRGCTAPTARAAPPTGATPLGRRRAAYPGAQTGADVEGHREARGADRVARVGSRPARGPRREGADGGGQARRGRGGVGRPKSTRPGLFGERGEAPRGKGRQGDGDGR